MVRTDSLYHLACTVAPRPSRTHWYPQTSPPPLQAMYAEAEPRYLRSMEITEKTLGPDHPSTASSLSNLAVLFTVQVRVVISS